MAKTKQQKKEIVDSLVEKLKTAKLIVLSEIKGLNVADTTQLRRGLRKEQVGHEVTKLSLLKIALSRLGIKAGNLGFKTQVAVTYSADDTASARLIKDFGKSHAQLKLLAGYLDKSPLDSSQVTVLATIPPRPVLLSQLLAVISGPARGLVTVLSGSHRGLVTVLSKVRR